MERPKNGFQLTWQNTVTTAILLLAVGGAFWALAYRPIQDNIAELKGELKEVRGGQREHEHGDDNRYLTIKEHEEFKGRTQSDINKILESLETLRKESEQRRLSLEAKVDKAADDMRKEVEARRVELATRADVQQLTNATRVELFAEIKRLDQASTDNMKRAEWYAWKSEYDRMVNNLIERLKGFTEALDSLYNRITQIVISQPKQ